MPDNSLLVVLWCFAVSVMCDAMMGHVQTRHRAFVLIHDTSYQVHEVTLVTLYDCIDACPVDDTYSVFDSASQSQSLCMYVLRSYQRFPSVSQMPAATSATKRVS